MYDLTALIVSAAQRADTWTKESCEEVANTVAGAVAGGAVDDEFEVGHDWISVYYSWKGPLWYRLVTCFRYDDIGIAERVAAIWTSGPLILIDAHYESMVGPAIPAERLEMLVVKDWDRRLYSIDPDSLACAFPEIAVRLAELAAANRYNLRRLSAYDCLLLL